MTKLFKPMLASPADLDAVRYPIFASPKLDGIRASVVQARLLSRTLKEIPSRHAFGILSDARHEGLDGELIVGAPTHPDCYRSTVSMMMADNKIFPFTYYAFDLWADETGLKYATLYRRLCINGWPPEKALRHPVYLGLRPAGA